MISLFFLFLQILIVLNCFRTVLVFANELLIAGWNIFKDFQWKGLLSSVSARKKGLFYELVSLEFQLLNSI